MYISIANLKNHYLQARCTLDNLHNFNYREFIEALC